MNPLNLIATLRKFGNFLVGLFPFLAVFGEKLSKLTGIVWLEKAIAWLKSHEKLAPFGLALERFLWKDYARDRLVVDTFPQGSMVLLRVSSLVSLALALFMPLALVISKPAIPIELSSGTVSSAPLWSIWLWMVAAPLGWGAILAGAVQCNRIIFVTLALACIYFVGGFALFVPRSYFNLIFPVGMFLAISLSGQKAVQPTGAKTVGAILSALTIGVPTGIFMFILTPLGPMVKPYAPLWGGITGAIIGLISLLCFTSEKALEPPADKTVTTNAVVVPMTFAFAAIFFAFVFSIVARGGARPFGEQVVSLLQLWNGYLWPLWYFVGVGIVYKVLKNAKIMTNTVRDLLPSKVFAVFAIGLILLAALIIWSPTIGIWVSSEPHLAPVSTAFLQLQKASGWFWSQPLNRLSADWMCWVLLFDLFALGWMTIRRQLTVERIATLSYFTTLTWLLIFEYMFQFSSFGQTPGHNVFLVIVFAVWLLWLFHTSVFAMCSQPTKSWPTAGRLGLYCGMTTLCLLEINSRTSVRDFRITNEIFLMMFRGIIDIGLPYFLYVLSVRRFQSLPVRVLRIFQCFCIGALLTFPFNVLDRLALSGWSYYAFNELWKQQLASFTTNAFIETHLPILPEAWLFVRAILYVGAAVGLFLLAKDRLKESTHFRAAAIFLLLSFASGFGSFSKTMVDLPLPPAAKVVISPFCVSMALDWQWLFVYLAALLPIMFFLLCVTKSGAITRTRMAVGICGAVLLNFALMAAYPGQETYLISTGMLSTVALGAGVLFLYMIFRIIWRLEQDAASSLPASYHQGDQRSPILDDEYHDDEQQEARSELRLATLDDSALLEETQLDGEDKPASGEIGKLENDDSQTSPPVIAKPELNAIACLALTALVAMGSWQAHQRRLVPTQIPALARAIQLPADWSRYKTPSDVTSIFTVHADPLNTSMEIGTLPSNPQGVEALAASLIQLVKSKQALANFVPTKFERWKEIPGKPLVVYYNFTAPVGKIDMPRTGVTVLRERDASKTEFFTVYDSPVTIESRTADIKRILSSTAGGAGR